MGDATPFATALEAPHTSLIDPPLLAAAGFLAGYTDTTRAGYTIDLRGWWRFCELNGLDIFAARRPHLELYIRSLEAHGYARSTIARRLSTVATYYRWCVEEEYLDRNPASHVRRPKVDQESTTLGLDRQELGAFLVEAGLYSARDHALACLLGLNGLRVSERTDGPILLGNDGQRLDRYAAYRIVRRLARRAGVAHRVSPHSLRHAFITAALDAGVPLRDVQEAASHADPRTTARYDRHRVSLDRHAAYTVAAFVAGACNAR